MKKRKDFFLLVLLFIVLFACTRSIDDFNKTNDNKDLLSKIERLDVGKIHNEMLDIAINEYNDRLLSNRYNSKTKYNVDSANKVILSQVYDTLVVKLSKELFISEKETISFLNDINLSKQNFIINNKSLQNKHYKNNVLTEYHNAENDDIVYYYNQILKLTDDHTNLKDYQERLGYLMVKAEKNLSKDDLKILQRVVDISLSSAEYWETELSNPYKTLQMKEGKGIKPQHKAIIKADVNGAIGGAITGATGGVAFAGVGSGAGAILGACLGASFSSAGEGLWQSIGW